MGATSLHRIYCGREPNWWQTLCAATQELIDGERSIALLPAAPTAATQSAHAQLLELTASPIDEPCLLLLTSGSTGHAKVVVLTRANLLAANRLANERLAQPGLGWVCALPPDHIGGFLPLFRSLANGNDPISSLNEEAKFDPIKFHDTIKSLDESMAVSLVWRQVKLFEQQNELARLCRFAAVLVGGGPADDSLVQVAADQGLNLIATYGMTETSGGVVWNGQALGDTDIEVDSPVGEVGVITVTGPTVGWGYLGSAGWNLPNRQHPAHRSFQTNDLGLIDSSGLLQVVGRVDDIVIINGHNVSLGAVETAIAQLPGVEEVGAFVCDQGSGERLFVATAPVGPAAPDLAQVRAHLSVTLGRGAHPAEVINLPSLPRGRSGKIDREELKAGL